VDRINYNQFFYFWIIAQEMSVTQAAKRLRLSQSNLSEQLRDFEGLVGQALFERKARKLSLTESGRVAFDYANSIFSSGQEMMDVFRNRPVQKQKTAIRVGAISSLSKNLQFEFIRPLLKDDTLKLIMVEGDLGELVRQLQNHTLDVVISNTPVRTESSPEVFNHRLGEIQVSLVGAKRFKPLAKGFPKSLDGQTLFLPGRAGRYRSDFEAWLERERVHADVRAEVEDMALLRLFAMSGLGIAIVPEIVVQRELESGDLVSIRRLKGFFETFYAVTTTKKFPNPSIEKIVRGFAGRRAA
jgi:LysR family transcriptional activator of nhaA